jgi:uncharacterized protein YraI
MKHMKKIVALVLVIMSVCTFALSASATEEWWVEASGWLNLRSTPSLNGALLDKIADGLPVTWYNYASDWSRISFDGTMGYVMTQYITDVDSGLVHPQTLRQAFGYFLLRRGCVGYRVKNLQRALISGGYYTGSINGSFDSATETAVRNYQDDEGLAVDGLVGEGTKSHLWSDYSGVLTSFGYVQ